MLANGNKHVLKWGNETRNRNFVAVTKSFCNILTHNFTFNKNAMQSKLFILFFLNLLDKIGKNYVVRFIFIKSYLMNYCFQVPILDSP